MSGYVPKVMFYNAAKGAPLPGERGKISQGRASIPVEVLFNENSSAGEVTPLSTATVNYKENGGDGKIEFKTGENMVLGHTQLSARPGVMDMSLAERYADRLVVPLGQEEYVRPEGIKATKAVLAAGEVSLRMSPWDCARLERHLAYGDEIHYHEPYAPLKTEDLLEKGMMNTGKILCGRIDQVPINGETLFDLTQAAGGCFTSEEVRQQYRNGGHDIGRVPGAYKNADKFLTGEFADFMNDAPTDKHEFAKALSAQWGKLDGMMGQKPGREAGEMAVMHLACNKMGWDFLPEMEDAVKMKESLEDYRNGDTQSFEALVEKSLYAHPQPQLELGMPERDERKPEPKPEKPADIEVPKKPSPALGRMYASMAKEDKDDDYQFEP